MSTITENERNNISRMFGSNVDLYYVTLVRLYVAPPPGNAWKFTNVMGAVAIMDDKNMKGHFLRVIDTRNMKIVFEQELYYDFDYRNPRDWFHTFESDNIVHGLSFADESEAQAFFDQVQNTSYHINSQSQQSQPPQQQQHPQLQRTASATGTMRAPPPAPGPLGAPSMSHPSLGRQISHDQLRPVQHSMSLNPNNPAPPQQQQAAPTPAPAPAPVATTKKKKEKRGIFGRKKREEEEEQAPRAPLEIGTPYDFKHESHIGWDANAGFQINNIPPEWKKLFQQAGIKKSDLRDQETASMLMGIVGSSLGMGAPPPPPGGTPARQAPPPPGGPPNMNRPPPGPPSGARPVSSHGPPPPTRPASQYGAAPLDTRPPPDRPSSQYAAPPPPPMMDRPSSQYAAPPPPPMMGGHGAPPPPPMMMGGGPPPPPPPMMGGGPPPPPPPPSGGGPPPPPPPPGPKAGGGYLAKKAADGEEGHSRPAPQPAPQADSRGDLLSAIRGGAQLKKVDLTTLAELPPPPPAESASLVDTLAKAMAGRRFGMKEEEEEEEEEEDEDDWSD
eukprot:TRINITY_DN1087_c0_g1_i3.p1 TRINITY_DN1087_c0_g1~~TRINITY_DN1087_c0_g1_i3.p1  ORF type:complete len:557 (+),score=309.68 TRINITY_DN1087_c0_g1_i3:74-1744(+)